MPRRNVVQAFRAAFNRRLLLLATAAGIAAACWVDGRAVAIGGIHMYQRTLGPLMDKAGVRCRFTPACSHYGEIVIARDGVMSGGWKTVKRIARCGPWTPFGTRADP